MNDKLFKRIGKECRKQTENLYPEELCSVSRFALGKMVGFKRGFYKGAEYAVSHQWISVEEALPEPEKEVVLFNKNSIRHYEIGWLRKEKEYSKSKWAITNGFVEDDDITHWMPIPKYRKEERQ